MLIILDRISTRNSWSLRKRKKYSKTMVDLGEQLYHTVFKIYQWDQWVLGIHKSRICDIFETKSWVTKTRADIWNYSLMFDTMISSLLRPANFNATACMHFLMLRNLNWNFYFFIKLRIHCFNNYGKNANINCPDLEVRYYIECLEETNFNAIKHVRNRRSPIICKENTQKRFLNFLFCRQTKRFHLIGEHCKNRGLRLSTNSVRKQFSATIWNNRIDS